MVMDAGLDSTGQEKDAWEEAGRGETGYRSRGSSATEMPDARKLAQDWITLWQSELTAMAADPEMRESWQTIMALWAGSMSTLLRGLPQSDRHPHRYAGSAGHEHAARSAGTADASRAAAAAAAPDARDAEIERLARHVAALERRLADLERSDDPPVHPKVGPKPGPGGRKQRK